MTVIHQWTLKLAETVAPDEVYLASSLADSYIANQQTAHSQILAAATPETSETVGSTSEPCDMHLLLPAVIQGISNASHDLVAVLSSDAAKSIITLVAVLVELKDSTIDKWEEQEKKDLLDSILKAKAVSIQIESEQPAAKSAIDTINQEVEKSGIPEQAAELTSLKTVYKLLADPKGSLNFLRALKR